jgi:cation transport regulator ChaC
MNVLNVSREELSSAIHFIGMKKHSTFSPKEPLSATANVAATLLETSEASKTVTNDKAKRLLCAYKTL